MIFVQRENAQDTLLNMHLTYVEVLNNLLDKSFLINYWSLAIFLYLSIINNINNELFLIKILPQNMYVSFILHT